MKRYGLSDWLEYLENLHTKPIDMGWDRISSVAAHMDLLRNNSIVITVAGTNGKGSCVAVLESVLLAAGYRVGAYTSPHLIHYNERIRIQGQAVSDEDLCKAFEEIEQARGQTSLTYFEFGTLAALRLFQQAELDIIILEVGLGGRLDAVNIIDPDIAIITTIDLDHMDWLGTDRESIAYEKAGIMRTGKPIICGDFDVPQSIYSSAEKLQAPLYCQNRDFGYLQKKNEWEWWGETRHLMHLPIPTLELQNVATAFKAIELLSLTTLGPALKAARDDSASTRDSASLRDDSGSISISKQAYESGLQNVFLSGRFENKIIDNVTHIFDVAHNPAGGRWLAERLKTEACSGRTFAVVGMLADKDQAGTLEPLISQIDIWYVAGLNDIPRGCSAENLAAVLYPLRAKQVQCYSNVKTAYREAIYAAAPGDRIVIFGSFHTVSAGLLC